MRNPEYLGDGVYVHWKELDHNNIDVILTTGNHDPELADNKIVLESTVLTNLIRWLKAHHFDCVI